MGAQQTWQREEVEASPSGLVNVLTFVYTSVGRKTKYEVGRFRHHFNWRTTKGLSLGAEVTKATAKTVR